MSQNKINIVYITIMWGLLVFVGYNVLTVEAAESDDKQVCEDYGGEWKDASGDYGHDRGCNFDNDKDQKLYSIRPGYSLDGTGADVEYGRIDLGMSDEEAAAIEDDVCDDEDAGTTNVKGCMSEKRELEKRDKILEKLCNKVDGKNTKDGCDTDGSGDTPKADRFHDLINETPGAIVYDRNNNEEEEQQVIEDYKNTVTTTEDEEAVKEVVKQLSVKDQGYPVHSPPDQVSTNEPEEESNDSESEVSEEEEEEEEQDEQEEQEEESSDESEEDSSSSGDEESE